VSARLKAKLTKYEVARRIMEAYEAVNMADCRLQCDVIDQFHSATREELLAELADARNHTMRAVVALEPVAQEIER
jgi:hypothetical protein